MLPLAIGAVVVGVPCTFQTPLSGQDSPVLAVLPTAIVLSINCSRRMRAGTFSLFHYSFPAFCEKFDREKTFLIDH